MKEIWKIIEGYTDYQISNYGIVKSTKFNKERILKSGLTKDGYLHVLLSNKNIKKQIYVHRLIANAFIHNTDNKPCVNHKDENKLNNCIDNLEWCTYSENHKHAFKIGLRDHKGLNHPSHKLTENNVLTIHGLFLSGMKQIVIAKIYKIPQSNISLIINGETWKHLLVFG